MRILALVLLAAAAFALTGTAEAARFQVQPTKVQLSGAHRTGSVKITNRSDAAVRFQIKAVAWSEDEGGAMKLAPTDDLVVYPSLFTLAPGASRSVRVAAVNAPGAREVPFRIFVEELPPLRRPDDASPSRITMLTRMGIPVFLPSTSPRFAGDVGATLAAGQLSLRLRNQGTAHVRVATVRVIGERGGAVVFDRSQAGWYLLPGGARRYQLALSAAECARVTAVRVEVATDHGTWRTALGVASPTCDATR